MNNPFQMLQAMGNPQQLLQRVMQDQRVQSDPRAQRAMQMLQMGDSKGLQEMATNLCREYGTTPEAIGQSIRKQFKF